MTNYYSAAVVTVGGTAYNPESFSITQDEAWTPMWQGSIVVPEAGFPTLDPKLYPRVRVQWYWGVDSGTGTYPCVMDCYLVVRSFIRDQVAGTVTIGVMSGEILLQDYKNAGPDFAPANTNLRAMFGYALDKVGYPAAGRQDVIIPSVAIPATAALWQAGQSLDEWLRPNMRANGVDLFEHYRDFATIGQVMAAWQVNGTGIKAPWGTQASALWGANITELRLGVDIDAGDWADAVVSVYSWTTATGTQARKVYSKVPAGAYHKVQALAFNSADPGFDPTTSQLAYAGKSGYTAQLATYPTIGYQGDGVSQTPLLVGANIQILDRDGAAWASMASRIEYNFPADTMGYALRNVTPSVGVTPLPTPLP